jgi:gas vesicle protein
MEDNTKNILIAAGSGVALGALLGVLFAPASGKETRQNIADKASDAKDVILEKKEEIAENIIGLKGSITTLFKDTKNLTKEQLEEKIKELENLIKKA